MLSRLSANDVDREVGRLVYTQWLNAAGGIVADLTVTRLGEAKFLVVASDIIHRRVEPLIRRSHSCGRGRHGHRRHLGDDAADGPGPAIA